MKKKTETKPVSHQEMIRLLNDGLAREYQGDHSYIVYTRQ